MRKEDEFDWKQPGAVELLEIVQRAGYSASSIATELAAAFGGHPSRCAVLGKLNRLGLKSITGKGPAKPSPERRERFKPKSTKRPLLVEQPAPLPEPQPIDLPPEQSDCAVTFAELTDKHCHWPLGEPGTPEFRYCGVLGCDLEGGDPYCSKHARIGYVRRRPETEQEKAARIKANRRGYWERVAEGSV